MKFGPQPPPDDYRIFKGTPTEFFEKVEREMTKHEKEAADRERVHPKCEKHKSVMTFGRYSKHPIYADTHTKIGEYYYYCNECVDELLPEYKRYRKVYK